MKKPLIQDLINKFNPHLVFLQETHLYKEDSCPSFHNFRIFSNHLPKETASTIQKFEKWEKTKTIPRNSSPTRCKGVMTLVHSSLENCVKEINVSLGCRPGTPKELFFDFACGRIQGITLKLSKRKSWNIFNIYAPNSSNREQADFFYNSLTNFLSSFKKGKFILAGDFNFPVSTIDAKVVNMQDAFHAMLDTLNLKDTYRLEFPTRRRYTYKHISKIDHFLLPEGTIRNMQFENSIHNSIIGDHKAISLILEHFFKKPPKNLPPEPILLYDSNQVTDEHWSTYQARISYLLLKENLNVESAIIKASEVLPQPKKSNSRKPFVEDPIARTLIKTKTLASKSIRRLKKEEHSFPHCSKRTNRLIRRLEKVAKEPIPQNTSLVGLLKILKKLRNQSQKQLKTRVQQLKKANSENLYKRLIESRTSDPTSFHKVIKKWLSRDKKPTHIASLMIDNKIITEAKDISDCLYDTWKSILGPTIPELQSESKASLTAWLNILRPALSPADHLLSPFTMAEMEAALKKTKNKSTPGLDKINYELIKKLPPDAKQLLLHEFNLMLTSVSLPDSWNQSKIKLLSKGAPTPSNFRPITLLPVMSKIFTSMLNSRILAYLENNNLLAKTQQGFRRNRSTQSNILLLIDTIIKARDTNEELHILYLDFQKAYDSVQHDILEVLLNWYGIPASLSSIILQLLRNNNAILDIAPNPPPIKVTKGLKQGDPLSPTLFNMFINPMLLSLTNVLPPPSNTAFADDLAVICKTRKNIDLAAYTINECLNILNLKLNVDPNAASSKTSYTTNAKNPTPLYLQDKKVPFLAPSEEYKYLGIPISLEVTYDKILLSKIRTIENTIYKIAEKDIPASIKADIINTYAMSSFRYSIATIPPSENTDALLRKMEKNIRSKFKSCCKIPRSFNNEVMHLDKEYGGFGLKKLLDVHHQCFASLIVDKISNGPDSPARDLVLEELKLPHSPIRLGLLHVLKSSPDITLIVNGVSVKSLRHIPVTTKNFPPALEDIEKEEEINVFTDGSFISEKPSKAVAVALSSQLANISCVPFEPSSFTAEATAALNAIAWHSANHINLVSDCKGVLDLANKINNDLELPLTMIRQPKFPTIAKNLTILLKERKENNLSIRFTHIPSHIPDKINKNPAKWIPKIDTLRRQIGENYIFYRKRNELADLTAKTYVNRKPPPKFTTPPNCPPVCIFRNKHFVDRTLSSVVGKIQKHNRRNFQGKKYRRVAALYNDKVSAQLSSPHFLLPSDQKYSKHNAAFDKITIARFGTLGLNRYNNKCVSKVCPMCKSEEEAIKHFFKCQHYDELRKKGWRKLTSLWDTDNLNTFRELSNQQLWLGMIPKKLKLNTTNRRDTLQRHTKIIFNTLEECKKLRWKTMSNEQ